MYLFEIVWLLISCSFDRGARVEVLMQFLRNVQFHFPWISKVAVSKVGLKYMSWKVIIADFIEKEDI